MAKVKNHKNIMIKEKFRKQDKTKKCSMRPCPNPGIKPVKLNDKETRILCSIHWIQWQKGQVKPPRPSFVRSSKIDKT